MGSFDGVAEVYEKARLSYPNELRDHLVEIGALKPNTAVVDLGAGTGQLSTMAADVATSVVAIDPEPDMVRVGQQATKDRPTIQWVEGSDSDILELLDPPIDLVLIGNAFHHMNQADLLVSLDSLVSPSGVVVICSTSIPVWLQDTAWSAALRERLSQELGRTIGAGGTPDHGSDLMALRDSSFSEVERWVLERPRKRSAASIVGEVVSSTSGAIDDRAAERLVEMLEPYLSDGAVTEDVKTTALIASRPSA